MRRWEHGTEPMGEWFERRVADRMGVTVAYLRAESGFGD